MTKEEAIKILGSNLHSASKLPGLNFGLPAKACIVGSKLREVPNSTCSKCYAFRAFYNYPSVVAGQYRRLKNLYHPQWVEAMVWLIKDRSKLKSFKNKQLDNKYFRFHDSGDLQSVQHLENIAEVARQLRTHRFWLPTREYKIVEDWLNQGYVRPKNLIIRLSAHIIDGPLPLALARRLNVRVSGVHTHDAALPKGVWACPSKSQGNRCM